MFSIATYAAAKGWKKYQEALLNIAIVDSDDEDSDNAEDNDTEIIIEDMFIMPIPKIHSLKYLMWK